MARPADPAIVEVVGMEPGPTATIIPHDRSRFTNTFELFGYIRGTPFVLLIKMGWGREAEAKFKGEHESLKAIDRALRWFSPRTFGYGTMSEDPNKYFLVTDYLDVMLEFKGGGTILSLGNKLSKMHAKPAPIPEGYPTPMFGFPVTTYCGDIPQDNSWKATWPEFYVENRLRPIRRIIVNAWGPDPELEQEVERIIKEVVPRLIGSDRLQGVVPSLLHGNLLFSKRSRGQFFGCVGVEEVIIEPSSFYGHSEYELGAANVYGFPPIFFEDYHKYRPKHEPKADWHFRVLLYELYHRLVAYATHGGACRDRAMAIMRILIIKYGDPLAEPEEDTAPEVPEDVPLEVPQED